MNVHLIAEAEVKQHTVIVSAAFDRLDRFYYHGILQKSNINLSCGSFLIIGATEAVGSTGSWWRAGAIYCRDEQVAPHTK